MLGNNEINIYPSQIRNLQQCQTSEINIVAYISITQKHEALYSGGGLMHLGV